MFKLYTKANRMMSANEFSVAPERVICNDVMLPGDIDSDARYNPHNVRMWLIGHYHGPVCAVFASTEQDALDEACDKGQLESFQVSEEETQAYHEACTEEERLDNYTALGNAGELHDLTDMWMAEVEFKADRDITLIVKLARASEGGHNTLDF